MTSPPDPGRDEGEGPAPPVLSLGFWLALAFGMAMIALGASVGFGLVHLP